jgi:hypothetical protein
LGDTPRPVSQRYADQNDKDYQAFTAAVRGGRIQAVEGI